MSFWSKVPFIQQYVRLQELGILGMNRRNYSYISRYNPRSLFPLVDDKLQTKRLALEHGVTVPELIGVIESQHDVPNIHSMVAEHPAFCIKPAKGSGGKGILVVASRDAEGGYLKSNGQAVSQENVQRHTSNILAGLFSLGGATDVALMETCIVVDESLKKFSHEGVPDIRVIVFRGIPVMAMMRLSCAASQGKANLHQGAVGVGLSISEGKAVNAVQKDQPIRFHPDTKQDLLELSLPSWDKLLHLACACADMSGLGYLGVDLVIDQHRGPMLLELNARPGLSIQLANNQGLIPRLQSVERLKSPQRMSIDSRLEYAQQYFHVAPGAASVLGDSFTVDPEAEHA